MKKDASKKALSSETHQFRQNFDRHLLENPNFFGTLAEGKGIDLPLPVFPLKADTSYEELTCVGYHPHNQTLHATIRVKQNTGYSGSYCSGGSVEFVRFFVDWDNSGVWTDEGLASVVVHDPAFDEDLYYSVEVGILPKRRSCCDKTPVLPKVRAILSWNRVPTAGDENFIPVWGNWRETHIQIAPRTGWICWLDDFLLKKEVKLSLDDIKLLEPIAPSIALKPLAQTSFFDLKKQYAELVEENRFGYPTVSKLLSTKYDFVKGQQEIGALNLNLGAILGFIESEKFNTGYEELTCVGLDIDRSRLHGTIRIKRENGYSGDLCSTGSKEYVAFYMDFGAGWQHMGTTDIDVHDINGARVGLTYDVSVPVNLDPYRQPWCTMGKAKVRAILSWNTPPPIDPNYVAPWGDWEECSVEIKPLPKGYVSGKTQPFLGTVGGMDINDINQLTGLATTTSAASLSGAFECAFDGTIRISGKIINPGTSALQYRLVITEPASAPRIMLDTQTVRRYGSLVDLDLVPDVNGWMPYYDDVIDDLLGNFYPGQHGLHTIRLEITDGSTTIFPAAASVFRVDKVGADVDIVITNGTGDCGDFFVGGVIEGTYRFTDEHVGGLSIYLTPGTTYDVEIDGNPVSSLSYQLGTLPANGKSGTWRIITTVGLTRPCGYNVWIAGTERVIVSSVQVGRGYYVPKGFCLK